METKKWYLSKTIWGSLIIIIVVVLRALGKEDIANTVESESAGISEWVLQTATLVGGLLAFIGRLTAKKELTT